MQKIDRLYATLDEVYRLYHGFHRNVTVRISGMLGDNARETRLFVKVFTQDGHQIERYARPFHTMTTARKYAAEMTRSLVSAGVSARARNEPEHSDYNEHMTVYRNYHADRDLPYYDFRRAVPLQNNRHVSDEERRYHASKFETNTLSRFMLAA
ncbi:MAG: hypothetical protein EOP83_03530 [Verrucomicrobiaceae bacterium]|nr:MAG: hypothetical protein EOP83_03530 [Verrucomicrobiaceae bacterium]